MSKFKILTLTAVLMTHGMSVPAAAKECKTEPIVTKGKMKLTKISAYPSSLFAWRNAVKNTHGPSYQAWRRAADRNIDCGKVINDDGNRRWQCTRTARPCAKNGRGDGSHNHGGAYDDNPAFPGEVLQRGSDGKDVEVLQRLLVEAGYRVTIDGDFGNATRTAVRKFQKYEAIQIDGVVGRETWDRLAG